MPDSNPSLVARMLSPIRSLYRRIKRSTSLEDVDGKTVDELSDLETIRIGLLPFKDQRWYHQLVILAIGVAIWFATYAGIMFWFGWAEFAALDTTEAITYRRHATAIALIITMTISTLLWAMSFGGPVAPVPLLPAVLLSSLPREVMGLFMGKPEQRFSEGSLMTEPAHWIADILSLIAIGYLPFIVIILAMALYWEFGGARGKRHHLKWMGQLPDAILVMSNEDYWERIDDDVKEVYREAGYVHDGKADDTNDK